MSNQSFDGIEVAFRQITPISQSKYPGFNPNGYLLPKGSVHRPNGMALTEDVWVEQDVAVPIRDGTLIRCDIFRPAAEGKYPAVVGWSPYGKRGGFFSNDNYDHPNRMDVPSGWEDGLNKFESLNPAYWVAHGYVILSPDPRGIFNSEGNYQCWSDQDADDEYDMIEWAAAQPWSNGKIGLSGNSNLAMSQWFCAAKQPPHLAAIAPWEGATDVYRDTLARGGIPDPIFASAVFENLYGNNLLEDPVEMIRRYPLMNAYWQSKIADCDLITVLAYVVAAWTNLLHTGGTFRAWEQIASEHKWLRVHDTHEWTDYYNPQNVEELRRFFDRYLKNIDNGWENTPKVRLSVLDAGNENVVNRAENAFPLQRQQIRTLYLGAENGKPLLRETPQTTAEQTDYQADGGAQAGASFCFTFDKETELTGYFSLKLWVEAQGNDDMDIFAFVRKRDRNGNLQGFSVVSERTHTGPNGRLRVSLRATDPAHSAPLRPFHPFDHEQKLKAGEIVPVEIDFWPYGARWQAGETLELYLTGTDILVRPEMPQLPPIPTLNKGRHIIHFGGKYDSQLRVPLIPNE